MQPASTDVVIAGAGPAGLTVAIILARAGVRFAILERDNIFRAQWPGGLHISPRTMEIFDDLGIVDEIHGRATANLKRRHYGNGQLISEFDPGLDPAHLSTPQRPYQDAILLAQHHTEAVLRARLARYGQRIESGCAVAGLRQHADHVEIDAYSDGVVRRLKTRFVVGCDGAAGTVRAAAGIGLTPPLGNPERRLTAALTVTGLDPQFDHHFVGKDGATLILTPLAFDRSWVLSAPIETDYDHRASQVTSSALRQLFATRAALTGVELSEAAWTNLCRTNTAAAQKFRSGSIFLAGDAARGHRPDGLDTAIADAHNLGWKLAAVVHGASDALLDSYPGERASASGADQAGGLVFSCAERSTLRPGDRAPDAPCHRLDTAAPVRLFDLFRGPRHTLLVFGDHPAVPPRHPDLTVVAVDQRAPQPPAIIVRDTTGSAARGYGIAALGARGVVLVRPDGRIALVDTVLEPTSISAALQVMTGRAAR